MWQYPYTFRNSVKRHNILALTKIRVTQTRQYLEPKMITKRIDTYLFKTSFHRFVRQQRHRPHEIPHQDKVTLGLEEECQNIVVVAALYSKFLLWGPLEQPNLKVHTKMQRILLGVWLDIIITHKPWHCGLRRSKRFREIFHRLVWKNSLLSLSMDALTDHFTLKGQYRHDQQGMESEC